MFRRLVPVMLVAALVWLTPIPTSASNSSYCAAAGDVTEMIVKRRNTGTPPAVLLKLFEDYYAKAQPRHAVSLAPVLAFDRWIVLYVYEMSAMDATWLRQRVETKCLKDFPSAFTQK